MSQIEAWLLLSHYRAAEAFCLVRLTYEDYARVHFFCDRFQRASVSLGWSSMSRRDPSHLDLILEIILSDLLNE